MEKFILQQAILVAWCSTDPGIFEHQLNMEDGNQAITEGNKRKGTG